MKKKARMLVKGLFILILAVLVFSYAMFQGGFVSWFLFYSVIVILLLSLSTLVVPLKTIMPKRTIKKHETVFVGDDLEVVIEFNQRFFHPFCYVKIVDIVPDSLHHHVIRGAGALYFLTFKRKESFTYTMTNLPRGEFRFTEIEVEIGDLFGFFERKKVYPAEQKLLVFPKYRHLDDFQVGTIGGTETKISFAETIEQDLSIDGIRPYVPGDKLTVIDWKHSARHNQLMSKQFSETIELSSLLVINPVIELKQKETFEKQVELAASFVYYYDFHKRSLSFISLTKETIIESSQAMYRELARIQPVNKSFVAPEINLMKTAPSWIVITAILSNHFVKWLLQQQEHTEKIVVCWIFDAPTEIEKQNRLLLRERKIRVYTFTDDYFQMK